MPRVSPNSGLLGASSSKSSFMQPQTGALLNVYDGGSVTNNARDAVAIKAYLIAVFSISAEHRQQKDRASRAQDKLECTQARGRCKLFSGVVV